ncbi:hypothetical protein OAR30_02195 [Euryarchaeota archaeon]|nr:hypothetical protein [Euryarchaeota archaeon]
MNGTVLLRSVHGKYLSAQPDGRAEWNRTIAAEWEYFQVEQRHNGKITLKSAHGTYVSAQPDGSVQINRREAPPGGWEVFTVEDRGNNVVCLKSCHGKYLSAQQNGTAQWNRDHAPRGGWEDIQFVQQGATGQQQPATNTASMPSYVIVAQAGSSEVNGNYEFVPGKHENRHWGTIAGHYQHTQNPEIFIAFQDCGKSHQRPEWNKWMIISKIGVLYAAHTGGKIGVPPREGGWETVDSWGNPGAPGGKHPVPTLYHPPDAATQTQQHLNTGHSSMSDSDESIQLLEAVAGKPVRFKLNNPPNHNDAWVGIYQTGAPDQDHGAQNQRWKYIRDIDVNNVSLSNGGWAEGDWGIRVFSDGGYTLVERKDFTIHSAHNKQHGDSPLPEAASTSHHTTQTVASQPLDEPAEKPGRRGIWIAALFGIFLILPGLPLLIVGSSMGEVGMIIPGAILTGFGAFLTVGAWLVNVSSWSKSYAESGKPAPRWTKVAAVFAVLLLIPGVILLVIGSISAESFVVQSESNATLEIFDVDDMGDQGFIIFLEATPGDSNNNGMHDYCENLIMNATHSGAWMSDPWQGEISGYNEADETRQVFELEIAHDGSRCSAEFWPEEKHTTEPTSYSEDRQVSLVKIGVACYGCMKGTTTISAEYSDGSKTAVMWIQDGEKIVEATGLIIAGSIMTGLSSVALISLLMVWGATRGRKQDGSQKSSIDILEATTNKGVYFRINNPPSSNDAWVGIYPRGSEDTNHGEEGVRWHWLRDIDVNKARFYEKSEGRWSIRVFSDSGFTLDSQDDFEIIPKNDQWWKD